MFLSRSMSLNGWISLLATSISVILSAATLISAKLIMSAITIGFSCNYCLNTVFFDVLKYLHELYGCHI